MKRVKITVLKTEFYEDLAEQYLTEGKSVGPCPILKVGDTFYYEGGARMPEGLCPWAWISLYSKISNISLGSKSNTWYKGNLSVGACSDGARPVIFLLQEAGDLPEEE